jgi:hypothetical protein
VSDVTPVALAAARRQLEAGTADKRTEALWLYYETPAGRIGDVVRLGDLGASHDRLDRVIRHSGMRRDGWWYAGSFDTPRVLDPREGR